MLECRMYSFQSLVEQLTHLPSKAPGSTPGAHQISSAYRVLKVIRSRRPAQTNFSPPSFSIAPNNTFYPPCNLERVFFLHAAAYTLHSKPPLPVWASP